MRFEWNDGKAKLNLKKHGIAFDEAKSVFYDEYGLIISDDKHSNDEERFILIGLSEIGNTLMVSHCERNEINGDEVIRIISARKATSFERNVYWRRRLV